MCMCIANLPVDVASAIPAHAVYMLTCLFSVACSRLPGGAGAHLQLAGEM